ncbi:MAG: TetR/AcrR family transcriptional regulator [Candidatus Lokiarchaeota archaeon]|nr:TetR/AcrR family transcriptional regulator [Candidatus Lokiarchaeota archaeon]
MPKSFTPEEKEIIINSLIGKGTELFGTYGLKKTNIEDLTKAVGIAKGSFYKFYKSKEELFFEVLKHSQDKLIKEMQDIISKMKESPKETFKEFLRFHFRAPKEHPIINQIADKVTRDHLIRKLHDKSDLKQMLQTYEYIPQFIKTWQKKGWIIKKDPKILAGMLKSLFTIGIDEETIVYIGKENYPEILENLIEVMADYMIILE